MAMDAPTLRPGRWFAVPFAVTLVADLITKAWIFRHASGPFYGPNRAEYIAPYSDSAWLYPSVNTGVAWSLFDDYPSMVALVTVILIPVLAVVYWRYFRGLGRLADLAFGAILGGALGNAYDRISALSAASVGGVRDFISVDLNLIGINYIWPTFNIADVGISVGFIALLLVQGRPASANDDSEPPRQS
ncbi:MAG: signal peptidase II [Planctomycetota bacterium]|jgi:signal peptidase II